MLNCFFSELNNFATEQYCKQNKYVKRVKIFTRATLAIRGYISLRRPVSVRPSVCPSVRPSQLGVPLTRVNVGSSNSDTSGTLRFLTPKISAKFKRGHPQRRRQVQVAYG